MMFKRIRQIKLNNWHVFLFLTAIAVLSFAGSAWAHFNSGDVAWWSWWDGALQNFSTEMLGAIITFGLIEVLVGSRNKHEDLVQQLRSGDMKILKILEGNGIALDEIDLSGVRWKGENLESANLNDADLRDANLMGANLIGTNLMSANLIGANLVGANLEGAYLWHVKLVVADLSGTNLTGANLIGTDLRRAKLIGANLNDADLRDANLVGANLTGANLIGTNLEGVILPIGTRWNEDVDMRRFTDKKHCKYDGTLEVINKLTPRDWILGD